MSRVVAAEGHVGVGDRLPARMADGTRVSLRVAAVYDRAAGLGDLVLDPALARRHAVDRADGTVFAAGGRGARRSLARYAASHPASRRSAARRTSPACARRTTPRRGASGS